jgi:Fe-S-cluster containining protein
MRTRIQELEMVRVDKLPRFSCRLCARCCHAKLIPLYPKDMERLGGLAGCIEETSPAESALTGAGYKMKMVDGRCALLRDRRCTSYEARPDTCRRHPFIVTGKNLLVASTCKGVDWSGTQESDGYTKLSVGISRGVDRYMEERDGRLRRGG